MKYCIVYNKINIKILKIETYETEPKLSAGINP